MMQKMDVLKNILQAITTNLKMLGMLSLLGKIYFYYRHFVYLHIFHIFDSLLCQFYVPLEYTQRPLLIINQLHYWALH